MTTYDVEKIWSHHLRKGFDCPVAIAPIHLHVAIAGNRKGRIRSLQSSQYGICGVAILIQPKPDETIRFSNRRRAKKNSLKKRIDQQIDADAKSQRQGGDQHKHRRPPQPTDSIADISKHCFNRSKQEVLSAV